MQNTRSLGSLHPSFRLARGLLLHCRVLRELVVHCANPNCKLPAVDLSIGVLRLIELDVPPDKRVVRSDGGFPVCSVPSRYFWLCPRCSSLMKIKRWTSDGLILEPRANSKASATDAWGLVSAQASPRILTVSRKTA